ncbi:MotA/TolQ/ExbB proton channel family protein [Vogesella urethralis]|jgi:biopolymer transport protein ExbB|uniref:MotA/TolQ/ExbB proton channel family protein n=1 Tax=Vogesella urethralis TaxID=2592656 RepID=UPI00118630D3|nr:MotA/TolQ/ExbB proton channel family protein [Vogesella urethralis]MEC5205444.1 biopolymer transport protein ExbB [Vogesella perlucida]
MNLMLTFEQGDAVLVSVFLILILMSVLTWYFIVLRGWRAWQVRRLNRQADAQLWGAASWQAAEKDLQQSEAPVAALLREGLGALRKYQQHRDGSLGEACSLDDYLTRALRKRLSQEQQSLEGGMTFLATIGSTAPFIGLFGTVWGIYNALVNIGAQGQVSIGTVAGPIGEALVATAAGLAAAIPAVLAYNTFTRLNRLINQDLDHFTHDLHSHLLTLGGKDGIR